MLVVSEKGLQEQPTSNRNNIVEDPRTSTKDSSTINNTLLRSELQAMRNEVVCTDENDKVFPLRNLHIFDYQVAS